MKKENKRAAQERKAAEMRKKIKRAKTIGFLKFWGSIVAIVVVAAVVVWAVATSGSGKKDEENFSDTLINTQTSEKQVDTETETDVEDSEAGTLVTDTSLVAEDGQTVNIDYTGYIDGEPFDGGSTDGAGADLTLGSNTYIEGFEDGVVGHKVGDTFTLNLKFPDDYWSADFAGKEVVFDVTLNGIYK